MSSGATRRLSSVYADIADAITHYDHGGIVRDEIAHQLVLRKEVIPNNK